MGLFDKFFGKKSEESSMCFDDVRIDAGYEPTADIHENPFELVNASNAVKPNYDMSDCEFSFDIYVSCKQEICIMGRLDDNYICGLSFSTVSDLSRTQTIVDGMLNGPRMPVSTEYDVLGDRRFEELRTYYKIKLSQENRGAYISYFLDEARYYFHEIGYFSHSYIAEQIRDLFISLIKRCEIRLADGGYLPVLHAYNDLFSQNKYHESQAVERYYQMKPLIDLVGSEDYLKLSSDSAVRKLYLSLQDRSEELYQSYMNEVR